MARNSLFAIVARSLVFYSLLVSVLFLAGIIFLYQSRLTEQRADAAERINLLLQVSLENAMLKRDIPGLMEIVERLGQQSDIRSVMILNPEGEVRFSSRADLIGRRFNLAGGELCVDCIPRGATPLERSELMPSGLQGEGSILRSVKSVANREPCSQCHGDPAERPLNGLLVVDHDAHDLKRKALTGALALAGSGMVVVLGLVAGLYRTLRHNVLLPVANLTAASRSLAAGNFQHILTPSGGAEIAELGLAFNEMSDRLNRSLAELSAREHFVQALLDALPDAVRVIGQDFRIVSVNKAYRDQLGPGSRSDPGCPCHLSSHASPTPCIPTLVTCPVVELKNRTERIKFHATHRRADGGELLVEVNAAAVDMVGPGGTRRLVIEVIRDLDAAVRISHEQRLSEIGQLATGVAHEIRNPLSSVAMLVSDIDRRLPPASAHDIQPALRLIGQEVDRCLAITESLLKLGSPSGQPPQLVDLGELVSDVASLLKFDALQRQVDIRVDIDGGLRAFAADGDLRIVLINLMQNAFHAMPTGGQLTVTGRKKLNCVELCVRDTGVGIPQADIASIFLPFWSRRADGVGGTGLGLAICRSVLHALHGSISVTSTPGLGTTFTVTLDNPDASREDAHDLPS